jgi:hypothetical protein
VGFIVPTADSRHNEAIVSSVVGFGLHYLGNGAVTYATHVPYVSSRLHSSNEFAATGGHLASTGSECSWIWPDQRRNGSLLVHGQGIQFLPWIALR